MPGLFREACYGLTMGRWQSRVTWALASRLGYVATVVCFIPNGADVAPFLNAALSAGLDKRLFSKIGHSADSNGGLRGVSLLSHLHDGRTPLCPSSSARS